MRGGQVESCGPTRFIEEIRLLVERRDGELMTRPRNYSSSSSPRALKRVLYCRNRNEACTEVAKNLPGRSIALCAVV